MAKSWEIKTTPIYPAFLKIKLRGAGLRIVYQLIRRSDHMLVIVIGVREDDEVYEIAQKRVLKHDL